MSVEKIRDLRESPEIKLNEGVDELSAVTDVAFTKVIEMENWRVSDDGERCEKRDGVADAIASGLTEYVTNGTFEAWSSATDLDDWTETLGGSTTIDREDTEQYAGTYCLKIDVDGSKSLSKIEQDITLVAGASYVLSFWYKGSESSGTLLHCGLVDSGNNKWLNANAEWASIELYDGGFTVTSTTTWTQKSLAFTAHASYTNYVLNIRNCAHGGGNASCQVYVDNLSIRQVNPFAKIFGYHTYYDSTPAFCQLVIDEDEVWRKVGSAAWTSIHTWASTLAHPVKVLDIQGKQIIITEIENIMILPDGTKVQVGITAPTTIPTIAAEYIELDLDENCASFNSQWSDEDAGTNGASTVDPTTHTPKTCFKFYTNASSGDIAMRRATLAEIGPDYTFETSIYFDEMGIVDDTDHFEINIYNGRIQLKVRIDDQGMYIYDGTNWKALEKIIKELKVECEYDAEGNQLVCKEYWVESVMGACPISIKDTWHTLKLAVKSSDPDNEIVEVFVDDKSMGEHSCANKDTSNAGRIEIAAYGDSTATIVYTDWIKLKNADIKTGKLKGIYRYAFTYARSGNYPNESNPIKAIVGSATYTKSNGTELDDLTPGGTYTGSEDMTIRVEIDGTTPDTMKWSDDGGETWISTAIPLALTVYLPFGIELAWGAITGHTTGDYWEFTCNSLTASPSNQKVDITGIPTSDDTGQVDQRKIYRTMPGGAAYYLVAIINDNSTETFVDNIPDALLGAPMSEDNDIAPLGKYSEWWDERLWIADDDENIVYYSKSWVPDAFDTNNRYVSARRGISNDKIMNMIEYRGLFYIFKRHGITYLRKKLTGAYGAYHSLKTNGNIAPWSLLEAYGLLMYLSFKGWEVFNGETSFSMQFSKPIRTTLQSLDKTEADKVVSAQLYSKDEIWLSIPDRTGELSAVTVVCNFLKSAFYTFSFSKVPSCLCEALDSSKEIQLIMGTRDGYIGTTESGTQDFGTNITATVRTGWWKFPIYQNFPMTEVEYECPTDKNLTLDYYVNFDKDSQRQKVLAGATPAATDQSIRLPIKNEIKTAIRGKYLAFKFSNAENVGSAVKLNWFKQFYAPIPRKGEIKGD